MATTPVTLNGVTYFVPQPGEQGPTYDQDLTNYLIALATAFPQGGASPSSTFQALISASSNPASAGQIRFAKGDILAWRNVANTGNNNLFEGDGVTTSTDDLNYLKASGTTTLITGQTYVEANTCTTSFNNGGGTTAVFSNVVTNQDSAYNSGTGTFTVPLGKGGVYYASGTIRINTWAANTGLIYCYIAKNGSAIEQRVFTNGNNGTDFAVFCATLGNFVATDTISFGMFQSNGAARVPFAGTTTIDNRIVVKRLV